MISLKQISNTSWHLFHRRRRSPFWEQLAFQSCDARRKGFPFDHRIRLFGTFLDYTVIAESEKARCRDLAVKYLEKHPGYLLKLMDQCYSEHAKSVKKWELVSKKNFSNLSNAEIARALRQYEQELDSFAIYINLPLFVEDYLEQTIMTGFKQLFGSKAQEYFNTAVNPVKDGTVLMEELDLLRLAKKPKVSDGDIEKHAAKYRWMANVGFFEEYYDTAYYAKRLAELKKAKDLSKRFKATEERNAHRTEFQALLKRIRGDKYLTSIVKTANEAVYFRSYRTEIYYSSAPYHANLFKEIAKRLGLRDYKDFLWLYSGEIMEILSGKRALDKRVISERKKAFAFITESGGRFSHWQGREAQKALEAFQKSQKALLKHGNEVKGSPAFPGVVRGEAVVVNSLAELGKVNKGLILVTHATNVNYVPVLDKVSAIVTEEGGILSHAAIISREMRIPCVIGTKVATRVFKDGDEIEVDAQKGVVRKL